MTETSTIPFPDLVFVSPPATTSAATASPKAVSAPNSNPTLRGVASVASAASSLSPPVPQVGPGAADFSSLAKATKDKTGMAGLTGSVRRSSTGTGLRVGESGAALTATSEFMDVTAGETAPFSPTVSAARSVDDLGSVQDALKMSTDGQPADGLGTSDRERLRQDFVTAGETAPFSEPAPSQSSRAPHLAGLASAGSALSFDAEVSALELRSFSAGGTRVSIKNVTTFAVAAASEIIPNSNSVSRA